MERKDITDELLIAFADGELTEPELTDVAKLVSEHKDLIDTVEKQKALSADLKDFFDVSSEKTPDHIADKIREMAAIKSSSNVVEISAFRKFSKRANISLKSLSQMAAALAIGVYFGPSVLDQMNGPQVDSFEPTNGQTLNLRSADGKNSALDNPALLFLMYQAAVIQQGNVILPGGSMLPNTPFKLSVTPPFQGSISIYEVKKDDELSLIVAEQKTNNQKEISFPKERYFEVDDQTEITFRIIFTGNTNKFETDIMFAIVHRAND